MLKILKRISLPTNVPGKLLRAVGTVLGIGASSAMAGVDVTYTIIIAATVLVFWISGDLQVAKDFKKIIDKDG